MTTVEHTGRQTGPVTVHINTQAADVEIVASTSVSGTWIELSTPDSSGPSVNAIRSADFRDYGGEIHLKLRESQGGGNVVIGGNSYGTIRGGGMTIINGVVMNGVSMGRILVRAIVEAGSQVDVHTMSGDVTTKDVRAVRAQTMSGDIEADGITSTSQLKSMSGDIRVTGGAVHTGSSELARAGSAGPRVTASTMSGDVTGDGVELDARSMSGRVRRR
jgi:Putative adhesin